MVLETCLADRNFAGFNRADLQYYLYMALIVSAFMAVFYLVFIERGLLKSRSFGKGMAFSAVVALHWCW